MSRRSRGLALALSLAVAVTALGSAHPASAQTGRAQTITLKAGQKTSVNYEGFPVPNPMPVVQSDIQNESQGIVPQPPETPAQCDADPFPCLDIPINLDVPDAVRKHHVLALSLTISYDDPVVVGTPLGDEEVQTLRCYLWNDHPGKDFAGNPVYEAYDGANNPGYVAAYKFPTTHFFLVVLPTRTLNIPFKVDFSFQDINADGFKATNPPSVTTPEGSPPSAEPPPAFSDPGTTVPPSTPIGGSIAPAVAPRSAPFAVPNIAGGRLDAALLRASSVTLPNVLGKAGSANISGGAPTSTSDDKRSATGLVVLELSVLPLLVLILTAFLFGRRRRQQQLVR